MYKDDHASSQIDKADSRFTDVYYMWFGPVMPITVFNYVLKHIPNQFTYILLEANWSEGFEI